MNCPYCDGDDLRVLDTRQDGSIAVTRQRQCKNCHRRFGTVERISTTELKVKKRSGEIESFSRAKIAQGIRKAVNSMQMSPEQVEAFVDRIAERLSYDSDDAVVASDAVGHEVLRQLNDGSEDTDVARIRFALVFLGKTTRPDGFRSAADAAEWLEHMYAEFDTSTRATAMPVAIIKRRGDREDFDPTKLVDSIAIASKGRGRSDEVRALASEVAADVMKQLVGQPIVSSQQVAARVLSVLRQRDQIAYLQYASITKPFRSKQDFWLEMTALIDTGDDRAAGLDTPAPASATKTPPVCRA